MTTRPRSNSPVACRAFHFAQGMAPLTICTREARRNDLTALIELAQSACEGIEGGPNHEIYRFCWNQRQKDIGRIYRDGLDNALDADNKKVYLVEDISSNPHQLLAAAVVVLPHKNNEDSWETLESWSGPDYARWAHYQTEISQIGRE